MTTEELQAIRELCAAKVAGTDIPRWGSFDRRHVVTLLDEIDRLQRGEFTETEFQNLCHNFSADDRERFERGCREYQQKLFGKNCSPPDPRSCDNAAPCPQPSSTAYSPY